MPENNQSTKIFLPWLTLIIIIALAAGLRFHLSDVPLERDEGEYAYAGQLILQGIAPYDPATSCVYTYPLMEPHPYALKMQEEMIRQIEAAKPKFLIFVNISYSWLAGPASEKLIFDWFTRYSQQYYGLVGVVDLVSKDNVVFRWNQDALDYHRISPFYITIFQRN